MELDFTKLNSLAFMDFTEIPPEEQLFEKPLEPEENNLPQHENASQWQGKDLQGIRILQRQADANKAERERALAVYKEYQSNTKISEQLQIDILNGAMLGENIYSLFLKAVQAISLMTSNRAFYNQLNDDIRAIYGVGLSELKPLELELEEVEKRLEKLREASKIGAEPADNLQRIGRAIQAHEQRIAQLKQKVECTQGGDSLTA